jgi:hypothetical protein
MQRKGSISSLLKTENIETIMLPINLYETKMKHLYFGPVLTDGVFVLYKFEEKGHVRDFRNLPY